MEKRLNNKHWSITCAEFTKKYILFFLKASTCEPLLFVKFFSQILLLLFGTLCLSGCVSAAMTGADFVYHRHRMTDYAQNKFIGIEGQRRLNTEPFLAKTHLSVQSFENTTLLVGEVRTVQQKQLAENIIREVPGVTHVVNRIAIAPSLQAKQTLEDAWLSTKVKAQIILRADFDPDDISIITENRTVYLIGELTESHAQLAITIARQTEGVEKVVTLITYLIPKNHPFTEKKSWET
jgi:osmotically-inducible protein OsmY